MNLGVIVYMLGWIMKVEGLLMLVPVLTAAVYREKEGFCYLAVGVLCVLLGLFFSRKKPDTSVFFAREGFVTVSLGWVLLSVFGCLPFMLSGEIPRFVDAMYEIVSGFTTTGSSVVSQVEDLSKATLMWRSFSHWIGGMGILVFILAVLPMAGDYNMHIMRAESPGPSVGKLVPKIRYTARILYIIYVGMTLVQIVLLLIGHMPLYDALTITFGTAGTGGFAIKSDSISSYSPYLQWVITIFMILFGVNFNAYYLILFRKFKKAAAIEEVRYYFLVILAATAFIAWSLCRSAMGFADALRHAAFQVGSIITTTGFATTDFNLWSGSCKTVLVLLMFIGACAGSTGGGIKVSRFVLLIKTVKKELNSYIHPKSIKKIKVDGKPVEHEVVRSTNVYFITFMILFVTSIFIVSLEGQDLVTTFTAVATTINNVGPGLAGVGPMSNFAHLSNLSKIVLMFDMLAGRLELFPLLILFHPSLWKDAFQQRVKRKKPAIETGY